MKQRRPQAVMMSKRANVFYLEHVRVLQKDERVVYMTAQGRDLEQIVNVPDKNLSFLLLGKGTSITDSAVRMLAESNVMIGFCGSGGSPIHAISEPIFLSPQDEYRPTEYMQSWAQKWFNDDARLSLAKSFLRQRLQWSRRQHAKLHEIEIPHGHAQAFADGIETADTTTELLASEAVYAKRLYRFLAERHGLDFKREPGVGLGSTKPGKPNKSQGGVALVNSFLDHGNYIAYGYAAAALHVLGIGYAFPVLHGKTRRGGLVFDTADLMKDWLVMPLAFECGAKGESNQMFRAKLIDSAFKEDVMDEIITFIKGCCQKSQTDQ